jgi:hypothetical protein
MFIRSSDQLPSVTVLKRFPVPRDFNVSSESHIERGKTWHAPARYDPDSGQNPRIDTYAVDLDTCGSEDSNGGGDTLRLFHTCRCWHLRHRAHRL